MPIQCKVVTPEKAFFEGEADHVVVPAWDGELAVYKGHAPLIAKLGHGVLRIHATASGAPQRLAVYGGFLKVQDDEVVVLAGGAAEPGNVEQAKAELKEARDGMKKGRPPKVPPGEYELLLEKERRANARLAASRSS